MLFLLTHRYTHLKSLRLIFESFALLAPLDYDKQDL